MKNSGYNHKLCEQVINAGTIAHREDIGRCKRGEKEDVPIQERKVRPEEIEPRKPKVMEEGESWSTRPHDVYKSSIHCRLKVSGLVSRYQFCKNAVLGETSYFSIRFPWPIFCI